MIYTRYNRSKTRLVVESDGRPGIYAKQKQGLLTFKVSIPITTVKSAFKSIDEETGEECLDLCRLIEAIKRKDFRIRILKRIDYVK